jgi:hypothetical protein
MGRIHLFGFVVVALSLSLAARARSQVEPEGLSAFEQTAAADLIVIGKVTDIEPEPVLIASPGGTGKALHLVATIRVEENLSGAKGLTHVRVAFVPELPAPTRNPAVKIFL